MGDFGSWSRTFGSGRWCLFLLKCVDFLDSPGDSAWRTSFTLICFNMAYSQSKTEANHAPWEKQKTKRKMPVSHSSCLRLSAGLGLSFILENVALACLNWEGPCSYWTVPLLPSIHFLDLDLRVCVYTEVNHAAVHSEACCCFQGNQSFRVWSTSGFS